MSEKETSRPQFKNFARLKAAKALPSISEIESTYNKYKTLHKFEEPKVQIPRPKDSKIVIYMKKYPVRFQVYVLTIGLSVFFSKPIWDFGLKPWVKPLFIKSDNSQNTS